MNDPQQQPLSADQQAPENVEAQAIPPDPMQEIENYAGLSFFSVVSVFDSQGNPTNIVDWSPRAYNRLVRIEQTPTKNITTTLINGYHPQYPPYYDTHVFYGVTYQYELVPGGNTPPRYSQPVVVEPPIPARPVVDFPGLDKVELPTMNIAEAEHQIDTTHASSPSQLNTLPAENLEE